MHPSSNSESYSAKTNQVFQKTSPLKSEIMRNQRRDPIGYFQDTKFGQINGSNSSSQVKKDIDSNDNNNSENWVYQPSWSNNNSMANIRQVDNNESNGIFENSNRY